MDAIFFSRVFLFFTLTVRRDRTRDNNVAHRERRQTKTLVFRFRLENRGRTPLLRCKFSARTTTLHSGKKFTTRALSLRRSILYALPVAVRLEKDFTLTPPPYSGTMSCVGKSVSVCDVKQLPTCKKRRV